MPIRIIHLIIGLVSGGGRDVYLFGGTDGLENLGDLWLFEGASLRWQRVVAVGLPPSPR